MTDALGCKLAPLGERGSSVLLEDFAAVEMAVRGLRVLLDRRYLDDPVLNHELERPASQMTGVSVEVEGE